MMGEYKIRPYVRGSVRANPSVRPQTFTHPCRFVRGNCHRSAINPKSNKSQIQLLPAAIMAHELHVLFMLAAFFLYGGDQGRKFMVGKRLRQQIHAGAFLEQTDAGL
ncbi:MAG: hypothetical protein BECKG1743F_GA0114225_110642 [Candidatus Kentron sp. G]|nr:MAG: hypothetical protein BECKG1743F_GA0114225_110642 [Candidatus Kentron sp. G]